MLAYLADYVAGAVFLSVVFFAPTLLGLSFLTLSFLIKKNVFQKVKFNEDIPNARHEDTLFANDLKHAEVHMTHIHNPVYHMGLDTSKEFIRKTM